MFSRLKFGFSVFLIASLNTLSAQCDNCPQTSDCFYQGEPLKGCQCSPAYNLPAAIAVNNKWCGCYNVFMDASFIYWHADEEGLELASNSDLRILDDNLFQPQQTIYLLQSFEYKPGFKVGAGIIGENQWMLYSEYTWIRDRMAQSNSTPPASDRPGDLGIWLMDDWFIQFPVTGNNISSVWRLHMDLVDLNLSRPYYQGRTLTISPFAGLQAAWIRQSMNIEINVIQPGVTLPPQPTISISRSNCWGVGPKVGCNGYCLLPMGFRLEGNASASILYTRFTKIVHKESKVLTTAFFSDFQSRLTNYDCLRPISELSLGLGWGSYVACQKYHIDFSASYDFLIFWQQNMIRRLADLQVAGFLGSAPLDLHLHGLTVAGRFDF